MNCEVKSAVYVNTKNGSETEFNFFVNLSARNKIRFVNTVVDTLVDTTNKIYNGIIRDIIFNFGIIEIFTDIDVSDILESADTITAIEDFLSETNVIDIVTANVEAGLIESLRIAVDENIQYKTGVNPNSVSSTITALLNKFGRMLDGVNVNDLVDFAQKINDISGTLTADSIVEAYSHSSAFERAIADNTENNNKVIKIKK